jgi:hypothetical protein
MFKKLIQFVLLLVTPLAAQTLTYPALSTSNVFTGLNSFSNNLYLPSLTTNQCLAVASGGLVVSQNCNTFGYTPLNPANNLSDVASTSTALSNLGGSPLASPTFTGIVTAPSYIDSGLTPSTSAICPNGTSGAFTTVGCVASASWNNVTGGAQTGSGSSQLNTFPGSVTAVTSITVPIITGGTSGSSSIVLNSDGSILQNMNTGVPGDQVLWGDRTSVGIPVPYVMPNGSAKNIAFDIVPLAGATNFNGNTGVAWTDICDGNFATACNQPGTVNYETIRLGIYATGDGFLSSEAGGTGTIHNLLLQNTLGNVMIGSAGSNEPAFSLVIAEPTNPAIELANQTLTSTNYVAMPTASNAFILGSVSGDFAFRGGGGNLLFGSNSSAPGPTLEITPGSPGTTESLGNFLVTDSHGSGSSQTSGASACSTLPTNFGTTSVNTGSATTSTVLSCLPANSVIDAITYRVTTAITTATSFTVGDSGSATRYSTCYFSGGAQALTLGATGVCNAGYYQIGGAALPVQLTFNATPGAGALRIIVYYHTWVPPQS